MKVDEDDMTLTVHACIHSSNTNLAHAMSPVLRKQIQQHMVLASGSSQFIWKSHIMHYKHYNIKNY